MIHELKCWPKHFQEIASGKKSFELRRNDRIFDVGDSLLLREYDPEGELYSGEYIAVRVTYMLRDPGFGLWDGYVVMGIVIS